MYTLDTAVRFQNNCKKLPEDVIINHILPYTYRVQYKNLLMDIRSFRIDIDIIRDTYYTIYNNNILLYDLRKFYKANCVREADRRFGGAINTENDGVDEAQQNERIEVSWSEYSNDIYRRSLGNEYCKQTPSTVVSRNLRNQQRKSRLYVSMLNPIERTRFINQYILVE